MNPVWMGVIALLIFMEKAVPGGERFVPFIGAALILGGIGVAFGWVPLEQITEGM
jgi:predicted metal-binding membrane protein